MKLLLASNGHLAINKIKELIKKPIDQIKIVWVITASKGGVLSDEYLKRHKQQMTQLGYDFTRLDIESKNYEQLKEILQDKDVVFVEGGNVFYLLKAIKQTGFDKLLQDFIKKGGLYVGTSAGSYIMCPTIEMGDWKHKDRPRYGLEDLTGLNYVPFLLFAHYMPEHEEIIRQKLPGLKYPLRILKDEQGIWVENGQTEFIGEGEEVKL